MYSMYTCMLVCVFINVCNIGKMRVHVRIYYVGMYVCI